MQMMRLRGNVGWGEVWILTYEPVLKGEACGTVENGVMVKRGRIFDVSCLK